MLTNIKYIVKDFWSFLKHPTSESCKRLGFFYYLIVFVLLMIAAGILRIGIPILFAIIDLPGIIYDPIQVIKPIPEKWFFLFAVFIAPAVEELSFRYPLKYKKNSLFIGFVSFTVYCFFTNLQAIGSLFNEAKILYAELLWWHIVFALLIFAVTRFEKINRFLSKFWDKYLIVIVYLFSAYFAYLHFPFPKTGINWIWLPVMVLSQFFSALYFSYIRLRVKFLYCIFLHMILNAFANLLSF
jgi:hypothetical protein